MTKSYCVILIAVGSQDEANKLAESLVSHRLAACVQIENIASTYRWQGKVTREPEYLLLIKTAARRYADVEQAILENHSYELPEMVQLPITDGLDRYLGWMEENLE